MRNIYAFTDSKEELLKHLEEVKFPILSVGEGIEFSNRKLNDFLQATMKYKVTTEDKTLQGRMDKAKLPKRLGHKGEVVYPKFYYEPFKSQKEAVMFFLERERVLIGDIMGPQPLWAKVHTPNGWVEMGDIKVGDYVTGQDGKPKKVLEVHEKGQDTVYEITFSDRTKAYSTDNHLWDVRSPSRKSSGGGFITKPLSMIRNDLRYKNGYRKHFVPIVEPIQYDGEREVEDAYMIGVYVGDGCLVAGTPNITTKDSEIVDRMSEVASRYEGELSSYKDPDLYAIRGSGRKNNWTRYLKEIGVYGLKSKEAFVPDEIKYGTANTRREFIRGLLDADGSTSKCTHKGGKHKTGYVDLTLSSERLLNDVVEIIRGLGGTATSYTKEVNGSTYYRAYLRPNFVPYKLSRKADNFVVKDPTKSIDSVEEYSYEDTRCISVEDELYLTDGHTVTHNTGKSFSAIIGVEYLHSHFDFKQVLVVNGVYNNQFNWEKEIANFSTKDSHILGSRYRKNGNRWIASNKEKAEDAKKRDEFYLITNVASLRNEQVVKELVKKITNGDIGAVIVDEMHLCANSKSQQGKGLHQLQPRFRLALSGTPFNQPMDMYEIEKWLGWTYQNLTDYENEYGEQVIPYIARSMAARGGRAFTEFKFTEPEKFRDSLKRFMIRRTDGLKDLPSIRFVDYFLELGPEQRKAYNEVGQVQNIDSTILSLEQLTEELSKGNYMQERRIISAPRTEGIEEDVKLETTKLLLEEILANNKTALIFTYFRDTALVYEEELGKQFPMQGSYVTENTKDVFGKIEEFQEGKTNFIVGGLSHIGTGFNITRADYVIYVDRPATWNEYEQTYMRAWRTGRKTPVTVIKLIAVDTWDDKMSWNLHEKKTQQDSILGATVTEAGVIDSRVD